MNVPGIVQSTLDGEEVAARVSLGGEDEIFVTPSRTIVYRADGLLSNESVDEFGHDADRLTLSEGRRKARFSLEYALDGTEEFTVPADRVDAVLHPVLAGILNGNGITDTGESVQRTYRFSELTLIITSDRLVKHVGGPVWDGDYEGYHYDDVTKLTFEDGSVATTIVLEVDGRQQRIKAPNEDATEVGERLKRALFAYHDVETLEELNDVVGRDDDRDEGRGDPSAAFGDGVDPLDADPPETDAAESDAADPADPLAEGSQSRDPLGTDATTSETTAHGADETDFAATGGGGARAADAEGTAAEESTAEESAGGSAGSEDLGGFATEEVTANESGTASDATPSEAEQSPGSAPGAATDSAVDAAGDRTDEPPAGLSSGPAVDEGESGTEATDASSDDSGPSAADAAGSSDSFQGSGFEPATSSADAELIERIEALESTVEKQTVLLERQQETIETLIEELRQGR